MKQEFSVPAFHRRTYSDETVDSICLICFRTVGPASNQLELSELESEHVCESRDPLGRGYVLRDRTEVSAIMFVDLTSRRLRAVRRDSHDPSLTARDNFARRSRCSIPASYVL
jgi:hypothetical protein